MFLWYQNTKKNFYCHDVEMIHTDHYYYYYYCNYYHYHGQEVLSAWFVCYTRSVGVYYYSNFVLEERIKNVGRR